MIGLNSHDTKPKPKLYPKHQIDTSQAKCLADQVLLYIRYACPKVCKDTKFQEYAEHLYNELVRGDIVGNPRTRAAGVVYAAAVMTSTYVTQLDIAEALGIAETSLRESYKKIKIKGKKQGLFT